MKRLLAIALFTMLSVPFYAQNATSNASNPNLEALRMKIDSMYMMLNARLDDVSINTSLKYRYKLYPTENIYTFLELDTKNGMIRQVQWSLDSDKEFTVSINGTDLSYGLGFGSNSFELYPTQNMYQFILLDKTDGRKWHVQWGMEASKRWIRRIF